MTSRSSIPSEQEEEMEMTEYRTLERERNVNERIRLPPRFLVFMSCNLQTWFIFIQTQCCVVGIARNPGPRGLTAIDRRARTEKSDQPSRRRASRSATERLAARKQSIHPRSWAI